MRFVTVSRETEKTCAGRERPLAPDRPLFSAVRVTRRAGLRPIQVASGEEGPDGWETRGRDGWHPYTALPNLAWLFLVRPWHRVGGAENAAADRPKVHTELTPARDLCRW
jgi:hypothetical protein